MRDLESYFTRAQEELKAQHIDRAVDILKEAYPLGKKQFLVAPQVDGQIGTILFMSRRFDESEPYLKRSFNRNWIPRAMLGVLYYKRKKNEDMKAVFEDAVKHNRAGPSVEPVRVLPVEDERPPGRHLRAQSGAGGGSRRRKDKGQSERASE
ncbi:MAG: hypothetical protein R3E66_20150 [bacterium]